MAKLNVDLRFAIIEMDGHTARAHADLATHRLGTLPDEIRTFVLKRLKDSGFAADEAEQDLAFQEIYWLQEELPRLESYAVLVVLFATFEATVKRLPRYVIKAADDPISPRREKGFVEKADRYFNDQLKVPLFGSADQRSRMILLADVRNAVAHANGVVPMLKPLVRGRIEKAPAAFEGVQIKNDLLIFSQAFIQECGKCVQETLSGAIARLKASYKPRGHP